MPPQRIDDKRGEAKEDHLTAQVPGLANAGIKAKTKDVAVSQMSPPILFTGMSLSKEIFSFIDNGFMPLNIKIERNHESYTTMLATSTMLTNKDKANKIIR